MCRKNITDRLMNQKVRKYFEQNGFSYVTWFPCCNTSRKYQLMRCCATWHDVTSQFQNKICNLEIYELGVFKLYYRLSKSVDILEEPLK